MNERDKLHAEACELARSIADRLDLCLSESDIADDVLKLGKLLAQLMEFE